MTRTAYAQLMGQRFHRPKIFGQWKEKEGSSEWRWKDIGMKVVSGSILLIAVSWSLFIFQACGFEMLYQENKGRHEISADRVDDSEVSVRSYVLSISVCVIVT